MTTDFERYLFAVAKEYYFAGATEYHRGEMCVTRSQKKYWEINDKFNRVHHRALFWNKVSQYFANKLNGKLSRTFDI
jgi:hypothetical protein